MISVKYYSSWLREAGRGHIGELLSWGGLLSYLVLALTALTLDADYSFYGLGNQALLYICAGLGIGLSYTELCYLFQQKKQDFYYSLPVRRSTIFWTRYINGLLTFAIPFVLVQCICGIYEAAQYAEFLPSAGWYTAKSIFLFLLVFLIFYHAAFLAIMVSGKVLTSVLVLAAVIFYFHVLIRDVFLVFAERLFHTYYRIPVLEEAQEILSPWILAGKIGGRFVFEKREVWEYFPGGVPVLAAVVFILLSLAAAYAVHRGRRTEMTGRSFVSKAPRQIIEVALSILGGLFTAGLLLRMAGVDGGKTGYAAFLLCAGGLAGTCMVHILMEWMGKAPGDSVWRRRKQRILAVAGVILTIAIFLGIQRPYDAFRPKDGDVEALSVCVNGLDIEEEIFAEESGGRSAYITDQRLKTYMLRGDGLVNGLQWLKGLASEEEIQSETTKAAVCFYMKNGAKKYRIYGLNQTALESFAGVYGTWEYKQKAYPLTQAESIQDDRVIWSDGVMEQTLKLTGQEKTEFLLAYKSDIAAMDMMDLYKALPAGRIRIESDVDSNMANTVIYPFWERTVSFLDGHGVQVGKTLVDYRVTGLKVMTSSLKEDKDQSRISMKFYKDKEEISQWADQLIPKDLAVQPILHPVGTETEAQAQVEDPSDNSIRAVQCYRQDL